MVKETRVGSTCLEVVTESLLMYSYRNAVWSMNEKSPALPRGFQKTCAR